MQNNEFSKILAANRGEIAIRIFRAAHDLGIHTVAMYSGEDTNSLFRTRADEAYLIGENKSPLSAYLDIPSVIDLAKRRGVEAIHPGYGFLSENAEFARACEENGNRLFIGPPSKVLGQMGDKLERQGDRYLLWCSHHPRLHGASAGRRGSRWKLAKYPLDFPVIFKAAAGGGGRGMRRCEKPGGGKAPPIELVHTRSQRRPSAAAIFFMEKFLVEPKHIEVQILARSSTATSYHLGERDCSLQRRYQKVVEFSPAWSVPQETGGGAVCRDAVKIAKLGGVCQRRDGGVSGGSAKRRLLLHRNESTDTGGAYGDGDGHRRGYRPQPRSSLRQGYPLSHPELIGIAEPAGAMSTYRRIRHSVPCDHGGPRQPLCPGYGQDHGLQHPSRRIRCPSGRRAMRRDVGTVVSALLRLAAGEDHQSWDQ
jgi:hypothetical protein